MQKVWNYFFYCTWKLQIAIIENIIEKPITYLFNLVPFFKNNWQRGRSGYQKLMNNKDSGINIGFAFAFMFLTTVIIYFSISLYLTSILKLDFVNKVEVYLLIIVGLSYLTNYLFLYRSDNYKNYFVVFDKLKNISNVYISAILFHLIIISLGILSIYLTIGFKR
jgi:hypothetical protein